MIGIGIDAVDIDRFRGVVLRTPRLIERLFTDEERAFAETHFDPVPRLAARFAAKEATMKALGVGLGAVTMRDIEITKEENGRPRLVLSGRAAALAETAGIRHWHVSITHTELIAEAIVAAD